MNAEKNIQTAQEAYADFGRGDINAILGKVDENVSWVVPEVPNGPSSTYTGKAGVAEFFRQVGETWNFHAFEPKQYIASGDQVAVTGSYDATARATGRKVSCDWCMVWTFRDGKLVHFQEYTDSAALRDACELRQASA